MEDAALPHPARTSLTQQTASVGPGGADRRAPWRSCRDGHVEVAVDGHRRGPRIGEGHHDTSSVPSRAQRGAAPRRSGAARRRPPLRERTQTRPDEGVVPITMSTVPSASPAMRRRPARVRPVSSATASGRSPRRPPGSATVRPSSSARTDAACCSASTSRVPSAPWWPPWTAASSVATAPRSCRRRRPLQEPASAPVRRGPEDPARRCCAPVAVVSPRGSGGRGRARRPPPRSPARSPWSSAPARACVARG